MAFGRLFFNLFSRPTSKTSRKSSSLLVLRPGPLVLGLMCCRAGFVSPTPTLLSHASFHVMVNFAHWPYTTESSLFSPDSDW